jgi:hypothetical protein
MRAVSLFPICALALPAAAFAQEPVAPAAVDEEAGFGVRAEFWPDAAAPGEEVTLRLVVTPAAGRYVYSMKQPEDGMAGLPLTPEFAPEVLEARGEWRESEPKTKIDDVLGGSYGVHERTAVLSRTWRIPSDAAAGRSEYSGKLRGMSCSETSCLPGAALAFRAALEVDPALAGPPLQPSNDGGWDAAARLRAGSLAAGGHTDLSVWLEPAPGRYVYALDVGSLELLPTTIRVELPDGIELVGSFAEPKPVRKSDEFVGDFNVHKQRVRCFARVRVAEGAKPGKYAIPVTVQAMSCDESSCLPAEKKTFALQLEVAPKR